MRRGTYRLVVGVSAIVALLMLAESHAIADPGTHSTLTAVTGQGTGRVLVAPTAADQGTFAVEVEVNIHDAVPNTTFLVQRAVDLVPDGACTLASGWLTNGPLTVSEGGAGAAHFEVHRGAPFVSGIQFDVVFRAVGDDGSLLASDCFTVTVK
jgi:hypothetical protein